MEKEEQFSPNQETSSPIPIPTRQQQTRRKIVPYCHNTIIAHRMIIPISIYIQGILPNWIKQEKLNNELWLAVAHNRPTQEIAALIASGANVNHTYNDTEEQTNGEPPLYVATNNNNVEIVTLLLQAGAHVNQQTIHGRTALEIALFNIRTGVTATKKSLQIEDIEALKEIISLLKHYQIHTD